MTSRSAPNKPTSIIRFDAGRINIADLWRALNRYGLDARQVSPSNAKEWLTALLDKVDGPDFVVLDNLDSTADALDFFSPGSRATVVATCRRGDSLPFNVTCQEIAVKEMTSMEAKRLALVACPRISELDAQYVAESLSNYPLAIRYACGLANKTGVPIRRICADLGTRPGELETVHKENLDGLFLGMLDVICGDELALLLLVAVVDGPPLSVSRALRLAGYVKSGDPNSDALSCVRAIGLLNELNLVDVEHDEKQRSYIRRLDEQLGLSGHVAGMNADSMTERFEPLTRRLRISSTAGSMLRELLGKHLLSVFGTLNNVLLLIASRYQEGDLNADRRLDDVRAELQIRRDVEYLLAVQFGFSLWVVKLYRATADLSNATRAVAALKKANMALRKTAEAFPQSYDEFRSRVARSLPSAE